MCPGCEPIKRVKGTWIETLGKQLRHLYFNADSFNKSTLEHHEKVPPGKFWELIGGYLTRGVCTATAVVNIHTPDNVLRRRLVVLASGASDTTDIPDDVARIRQNEIIEGDCYIRVLFGGAQNPDSLFNIDVLENDMKELPK